MCYAPGVYNAPNEQDGTCLDYHERLLSEVGAKVSDACLALQVKAHSGPTPEEKPTTIIISASIGRGKIVRY